MDVKKFITLRNGVEMQGIGFGTWKSADGQAAYDSVIEAIKAGYRHIDTATLYKNEASVGKAVNECGLKREEIFVTSKVWNRSRGYDKTMAAFEKTLSVMGLDYLDLYLIHWPAIPAQFEDWNDINLSTWKALTELYKAGKIKAIGTANFFPQHLESLMQTEVQPMINQIEYHPGYTQDEVVKYCQANGIVVQGWSPLGNGAVLNDAFLGEMAAKYGKSVAQICLRFAVQNGIVPLPKSVTPSRIASNLDIYDFEISEADMKAIAAMPETGFSGWNPNEVDF
ncbi:aldo/keto reductase [Frisingicoccus sp.]|uniref:aldo/keto reductase n=1 Tax=Frisingicoccus sp. TaxID=1918627 RepID=UPI002ECBB97E|nr:aldo/keto reductase [Frisingicoccus sp.]